MYFLDFTYNSDLSSIYRIIYQMQFQESHAAEIALNNMGELQYAEALEPAAVHALITATMKYHGARDATYEGSKGHEMHERVKRHATDLMADTKAATARMLGLTAGTTLDLDVVNNQTGQARDTLRSYERVQLISLQPNNYNEAIALIPSLGRFDVEGINQLLHEIAQNVERLDERDEVM